VRTVGAGGGVALAVAVGAFAAAETAALGEVAWSADVASPAWGPLFWTWRKAKTPAAATATAPTQSSGRFEPRRW
jgi:hypothetical protein